MKEKCLDIGTIQAFLDGELPSGLSDNAARHLSACDRCALQLTQAEEETAVVFSALEKEFNALVPTQRLWAKINDSIQEQRKSFWQPILAFFKNPTVGAFAAFLVVFGLFVAYLSLRTADSTDYAAVNEAKKTVAVKNVSVSVPVKSAEGENPANEPETVVAASSTEKKDKENNKNYRVVTANFDEKEIKRKTAEPILPNQDFKPKSQPASYEYIPGEQSYIKTIASLEKTIDGSKEEVLNASAQFNFARNIAVVDDAINKLRAEVKKNPGNETARQLLMTSYQNKVDLLNSVAEKTELMASIK